MSITPPAATFRIASVAAVLNTDGSVKDYITDLMAGGTVTIDTTAEVVRTCSFQCLDPKGILTPSDQGGQLTPDGVEVQLFGGYFEESGTTLLWPLGIFGVSQTDVATGTTQNAPGPVLSVTASDRSQRISAHTFADAFNIAAGSTVAEAVHAIVDAQAPWVKQISIAESSAIVAAQALQPGDDPWQAIQEMCAPAGQLAYFDPQGVLRVIDDPSKTPSKPVVAFAPGLGNLAVKVTKSVSNSPGYNGVIVEGQSLSATSSAVAVGSAFDMDPSSQTYALGPYGKRPAPPVQASTASTDAACAAIAKKLLPQVLGLTHQTTVDCVPIFAMDAYQLFYAQEHTVGVDGVRILERATIPLDYSQLESLTGVPLGTPITAYDGLNSSPSVAAYAPVMGGAWVWNASTGAYSYSSGSGSGFSLGSGLLMGGGTMFMGAHAMRLLHGPRGVSRLRDWLSGGGHDAATDASKTVSEGETIMEHI